MTTHIAQLKWSFLILKIVHILIIESDDKDPKFEADGHVRISKYKSIFAKDLTPISSKEAFIITK